MLCGRSSPAGLTPLWAGAVSKQFTRDWSYLRLEFAEDGSILLAGVTATRFGGADDTEDNGVGVFGFDVRTWGESIPGVALPFRSSVFPDSPIPKLVPFQPVRVHSPATGKTVVCVLVDLGPSVKGKALDLTNAAVRALGLDPAAGNYAVSARIIPAKRRKK